MATVTPKGHKHQKVGEPQEEPKPPKEYTRRDFLHLSKTLLVGGVAAKVLASTPVKADDEKATERVAQAPARPQVRTDMSAGPNSTDRVLRIPTDAQPAVLTGEQVRRDYGYMFENGSATVMDLPAGGKITMGDWEVEVTPSRIDLLTITIRNASLNYEYETTAVRDSKLILLPFPETEYAKGPLFAIVSAGIAEIYFYNKVSDCVTAHGFIYADQMLLSRGNETPEVGTDVYNNEPYIVVVRAGSRTANGDVLPGTRIFQYALGTTEPDGDGPAAGMSYFVRGND